MANSMVRHGSLAEMPQLKPSVPSVDTHTTAAAGVPGQVPHVTGQHLFIVVGYDRQNDEDMAHEYPLHPGVSLRHESPQGGLDASAEQHPQ